MYAGLFFSTAFSALFPNMYAAKIHVSFKLYLWAKRETASPHRASPLPPFARAVFPVFNIYALSFGTAIIVSADFNIKYML